MKADTIRTDALRPLSDIQIEQTREFIDSLEQGSQTYWDMVEIEKYQAIDRLDAHKRERFWIETLKATLNKKLPTRTNKEYSKKYNNVD